MLKSILGVFWNLYKTIVYHVADIKYDTEWCDYAWNVVEYCNRVNSRLVVIKFNTACWNQNWEYSGIYIKR